MKLNGMVARLALTSQDDSLENDILEFDNSKLGVFGVQEEQWSNDNASHSMSCDDVVQFSLDFLKCSDALDVIIQSAAKTRSERDDIMSLANRKSGLLLGCVALYIPRDLTWRRVASYFFTHALQQLFDQRCAAKLNVERLPEPVLPPKPVSKSKRKAKNKSVAKISVGEPQKRMLEWINVDFHFQHAWVVRRTFISWEDPSFEAASDAIVLPPRSRSCEVRRLEF